MNADNSTPNGGAFRPESAPAPASTRVQRSGFLPPSGQQATTEAPPTSQGAPTRTSVRPTSGSLPTTAPARPVTGSQPLSGSQPPTGGQPTTGTHPAGDDHQSAAGAALGRLKGVAQRAKEQLTEGDDIAAASKKGGPRKARVLLSRVDPWSALKMGFLLSIAAGIMLVVAVFVIWNVLNSMGFFLLANDWVSRLFSEDQELNLLQFFDQNKWMSAAVLIAVVNVVLLTALSTIGAFLYNTVSSVVGGVYVTLTDD